MGAQGSALLPDSQVMLGLHNQECFDHRSVPDHLLLLRIWNPALCSCNPTFCMQPAPPDHPFSVCTQYLRPVSTHSLWSVSMKSAMEGQDSCSPGPQNLQRSLSCWPLQTPLSQHPGLLVPYFLDMLLAGYIDALCQQLQRESGEGLCTISAGKGVWPWNRTSSKGR